MQTTLAATALLMGLAGGPHCIAMCGAACAGIGRANGASGTGGAGQTTRSLWIFQAGRLLGYSALGGLAAASMQGLGWLSVHSAAIRPVWTLFHAAAALMGLMLLWQARQPAWLERSARKVWQGVRTFTASGSGTSGTSGFKGGTRSAAPLLIGVTGVLWALLPCGLLYSALLVAAMAGSVHEGAAVMALFALGSGVSLMAGPWVWLKFARRRRVRSVHSVHSVHSVNSASSDGRWAIRIAGLALFATSAWALWMGLVHNTAPWCLTP